MIDPCWARVSGPLEPYGAGLRVELERLGYTPLSAAGHVRLVAHLSGWMLRENLAVSELTVMTLDAYFADRRAAGYSNSLTRRSVQPLLDHLRRLGAVPSPEPQIPETPTERLLIRFRDYLLTERGLAASTAELNVRLIRPSLAKFCRPDGQLDLERLDAHAVSALVVSWGTAWPRSVGRMVTALRSLLRFAYVDGLIDRPLSVPSVASWKLAGLPKALEPGQIATLLDSCDRSTATGCRDFAILMLLTRLGLRAGEVANLGLGDINWRHGEIVVRGKGNRHDCLPLPADVGRAIVDYLRRARPGTAQDRTVFVRAQAPHRALTSGGVTAVVAFAGRRCGFGPIYAHRLRHSVATAMLAAGGSLAEIGQILRHQRMLTTAIYAKVDIERLRHQARPWPEVAK